MYYKHPHEAHVQTHTQVNCELLQMKKQVIISEYSHKEMTNGY